VAAIEPILGPLGLELYDIELIGTAGKSRALRVLVDRAAGSSDATPDAGLGLDAVTEATLAISPELDRLADAGGAAAAVLRGHYTLEVSSPGLERPLRRPAHWRGAIGSTASVKTMSPAGDTMRRHGVVLGVDDDGVDLEIDGDRAHVAYTDIVQARTVFEWGAQAKPRAGTGKRSRSKFEKVTQ
jgi:ribosome maturation factor RimP